MESWYCSVTDSILLSLSYIHLSSGSHSSLPGCFDQGPLYKRLEGGGMLGFKSRQKIRRIATRMAAHFSCLVNYIFEALLCDRALSLIRERVLIFEPSCHAHPPSNLTFLPASQSLKMFEPSNPRSLFFLVLLSKISQCHEGARSCNETISLRSTKETAPKLHHILLTRYPMKDSIHPSKLTMSQQPSVSLNASGEALLLNLTQLVFEHRQLLQLSRRKEEEAYFVDYIPPARDAITLPRNVVYVLVGVVLVIVATYAIVGHLIKDLMHDLAGTHLAGDLSARHSLHCGVHVCDVFQSFFPAGLLGQGCISVLSFPFFPLWMTMLRDDLPNSSLVMPLRWTPKTVQFE